MSMLRICAAPDCSTRTLGHFCLAHETSLSHQQPRRRKAALRSATTAAQPTSPGLSASTAPALGNVLLPAARRAFDASASLSEAASPVPRVLVRHTDRDVVFRD
jgi:hypothetical protein